MTFVYAIEGYSAYVFDKDGVEVGQIFKLKIPPPLGGGAIDSPVIWFWLTVFIVLALSVISRISATDFSWLYTKTTISVRIASAATFSTIGKTIVMISIFIEPFLVSHT